MVELADTPDSSPGVARRESSSLSTRTYYASVAQLVRASAS